MTEPKLKLEIGSRLLDRYEVLAFLGKGGMAQVFRGLDTNIGREVAIKVLILPESTYDDDTRQNVIDRFHREARAAARIRHPNVVTIHDFGESEATGEPFMVMELLEGHDLQKELVEHGAMSPERAFRLFAPCLDALAIAHKDGIVHKDLKPENLFLEYRGTEREVLRIVDFGVAHVYDDGPGRLTQTGQMFSTPEYVAPEYVNDGIVAPTFDVYQMALILAETLSGSGIVRAENPYQCAIIHGVGKIALPSPLLVGALGEVFRKALTVDPDQRYQHAGEFATDLRTVELDTVEPLVGTDQWVSVRTGKLVDRTGTAPAAAIGVAAASTMAAPAAAVAVVPDPPVSDARPAGLAHTPTLLPPNEEPTASASPAPNVETGHIVEPAVGSKRVVVVAIAAAVVVISLLTCTGVGLSYMKGLEAEAVAAAEEDDEEDRPRKSRKMKRPSKSDDDENDRDETTADDDRAAASGGGAPSDARRAGEDPASNGTTRSPQTTAAAPKRKTTRAPTRRAPQTAAPRTEPKRTARPTSTAGTTKKKTSDKRLKKKIEKEAKKRLKNLMKPKKKKRGKRRKN